MKQRAQDLAINVNITIVIIVKSSEEELNFR